MWYEIHFKNHNFASARLIFVRWPSEIEVHLPIPTQIILSNSPHHSSQSGSLPIHKKLHGQILEIHLEKAHKSERLLALRLAVTMCVSANKHTENSVFVFNIFFYC